MATIKINKFMAGEPYSPPGKDYTIYSYSCEGEVDGSECMFKCKTFNKDAAALVKEGAVIEGCEAKTWNNETEYVLPKVARQGGGFKGGGGGWKKDPATELSIIKQTVFKGAIELACHDKIDLKDMEKFMGKWVGIITGEAKVEKAPF